ncbi:unnamed protein product [Allacma fusca]|uniref:Uncharacterized protein n=1 Tax=Allacma fusca TaxID=39272 RepID=A0A8J2JSN5_9HEXA|nr:unnamed protein product [Allacma fusca]
MADESRQVLPRIPNPLLHRISTDNPTVEKITQTRALSISCIIHFLLYSSPIFWKLLSLTPPSSQEKVKSSKKNRSFRGEQGHTWKGIWPSNTTVSLVEEGHLKKEKSRSSSFHPIQERVTFPKPKSHLKLRKIECEGQGKVVNAPDKSFSYDS